MKPKDSRIVMSIIVQRSDELEKVGDDVRAFARRMRKELGEETSFEIQVGVNPLANDIDQRNDVPRTPKRIGFFAAPSQGADNGTQENSEGRT